jgi:hypothetical protein
MLTRAELSVPTKAPFLSPIRLVGSSPLTSLRLTEGNGWFDTRQVCTGVGIAELAVGGSEGAEAVDEEYSRARKSYESNPIRKAKALAISGRRSGEPQ